MPELRHTLAYRIVRGAVHSALDAHPHWKVPAALPRSVAKRAAGLLLAQAGAVSAQPIREAGVESYAAAEGGAVSIQGTAPPPRQQLAILHLALGSLAGEARRRGDDIRFAAITDALRLVAMARAGDFRWRRVGGKQRG